MATAADALSALNNVISVISRYNSQLSSYQQRINSIDPASPDASAQLQSLNDEFNNLQRQANSEIDPLYNNYVAIAETLTPEQLSLPELRSADVSYDSATSQYDSVVFNTNNAIDGLRLSISSAQQIQNTDPKTPSATEQPTNAATEQVQNGTTAPSATGSAQGLSGLTDTAQAAANNSDQAQFQAKSDWRVRLSLAPESKYLYNDPSATILQPLKKTDGVIFPYTPSITVSYAANYEGTNLTHTNYRIYQYQNSSVDQVQLTCEFTCQDVFEANYLLAVIHFFRTMTKMFYGQDSDPKNGTPPPLCYIFGLGGYQFDALPLAISGFTYSLPADVDYIKTVAPSAANSPQPSIFNTGINATGRAGQNLPGGRAAPPSYGTTVTTANSDTTWVPTKIQLAVTCLPILSRNQVSNYFSLKDYASGKLLRGTVRRGGGFW